MPGCGGLASKARAHNGDSLRAGRTKITDRSQHLVLDRGVRRTRVEVHASGRATTLGLYQVISFTARRNLGGAPYKDMDEGSPSTERLAAPWCYASRRRWFP
jgi:hypothetical protein